MWTNKMSDQNNNIDEFEKVQFEKISANVRHLSNAFYLTLGFFIAITGWFIILLNDGNTTTENISGFIGILFVLMLLNLAKVSRLHSDNKKALVEFDDKYDKEGKKIRFRPTGIPGLGDAIHYIILISITSFYLLFPFICFNSIFTILYPIILSSILFAIIYYGFASGDFLISQKEDKQNKLTKNIIQWFKWLFYVRGDFIKNWNETTKKRYDDSVEFSQSYQRKFLLYIFVLPLLIYFTILMLKIYKCSLFSLFFKCSLFSLFL